MYTLQHILPPLCYILGTEYLREKSYFRSSDEKLVMNYFEFFFYFVFCLCCVIGTASVFGIMFDVCLT